MLGFANKAYYRLLFNAYGDFKFPRILLKDTQVLICCNVKNQRLCLKDEALTISSDLRMMELVTLIAISLSK